MISFVVHGKPEPGGSKRHVGKGRVIDANPKAAPWKIQVAWAVRTAKAGRASLEGPLAVSLVFKLKRPKGHYGARGLRPGAPAHPTVRPDVLKLARAVEDACTDGGLWRDDAQIVVESLRKEYADEACVEVKVWELAEEVSAAA